MGIEEFPYLDLVPQSSVVGVREDLSGRFSGLLVGPVPDGVILGLDGEDAA